MVQHKKKDSRGEYVAGRKQGWDGWVLFFYIYMQQAMTIRSRIGWNKDKSYNDEGKKFSN
jgi:hypothetical protein